MVGLGNPGERYRRTRHNVGFMVVDALAARSRAEGRVVGDAWVAAARVGGCEVLLVKPLSFMNASGAPVARVLAERSGSPADLAVVVDDVALALGRIRVRERGSHGGHNGLRSLAEVLGTDEFPRVRIGVGGASRPLRTSRSTCCPTSCPTRCCSCRRRWGSPPARLRACSRRARPSP